MAALRNGIETVIIPRENEKDLEEIDQTVRRKLRFVPVSRVEEVFSEALVSEGKKQPPSRRRCRCWRCSPALPGPIYEYKERNYGY